jgi:fucose permease
LYIQYGIIAGVVFVTTLVIVGGPNPEAEGKIGNGPPVDSTGKKIIPHYNVEIVIGLMVFCFIGGKVTATAYLETYIEDTGVISTSKEADAVLVLWIAITIGRLAGVYDQRFLTNRSLPVHLSILCVGGTLAMLMMLWFPNSSEAFWIGVAAYGLFNGPCVGYCYDWNNRITYPTEKSMSIVMFGLNFGASLVPYITTLIWDAGGGPTTMTVVIFLSMFIPLPLLHMTKFLSYDPAVNPTMKHVYNSIPASEDDVDAEVGLEEPKRS